MHAHRVHTRDLRFVLGVPLAGLLACRSERLPVADQARPAAPSYQPSAADAPPPRLLCTPPTRATPLELDGDPGWACTDPHGRKNGPFFTLLPDGGTDVSGTFRDDRLQGTWRRMFRNGKVAEVGSYVDGLKDGTWRLYTDHGGLLGDYQMVRGTGVERRWYFDGQLASERRFVAGVLDGPSTVYGDGGAVMYAAQFRAGQLDGPRHVGLPGAMRVDDRWAAGVARGSRKIWRHEALTIDMTFDDDGQPAGPFTAWRDRVSLRERGTYVRGARHGVWQWYDRGRGLEREGGYVLGARHGLWREWVGGRLTMQGRYVKGRPHGTFKYWNKFGRAIGTCVMRNGTGTMTTFHDNGRPATKLAMVRGLRQGAYRELSPRGLVLVKGSYLEDLRHGPWIERDADGRVVREATYVEGKLDGPVRHYIDGHLASVITYAEGVREGEYRELRRSSDGGGDVEVVTGTFADDLKSDEWTYRGGDGRPSLIAHYQAGVLHGGWQQVKDGQVVVRGQYEQGRRTGIWTWSSPGVTVRTVTYDRP